MTANNAKSLFKYAQLDDKGNVKYSLNSYVALLFICVFLLLTLGCFMLRSLLISNKSVEQYNVSTPLGKGQYRATVYSLFTSLLNERPTQFGMREADIDNKPEPDMVISCYYNTPTNFSSPTELLPEAIHPRLCTHINVAFAQVVNKTIRLNKNLKRTIREVVKLKSTNPDLKVLLSIGGSGENDGFSDMVVDHASRKVFIKSIKAFLTKYKVDGIDLDWEFPVIHDTGVIGAHPRERQHFSQLLREIRVEYQREKRNYLLTVAAAAPQAIVDNAYDVDQLNLYTDYVNIMTYDFHYYSRYTPFTGLNSPIYPTSEDITYLSTLNINSTVNMYITKGLDPDKIVVGIPTYGHTFTLVNSNNPQIGSPASGYGALGSLGFVNYPVICKFIQEHIDEVVVQTEMFGKVPYMYRGHEWVSFENGGSVMEKAKYVKRYGLRGAMIYSLNADDYMGDCNLEGKEEKFPLTRSIKSTLLNENMKHQTTKPLETVLIEALDKMEMN